MTQSLEAVECRSRCILDLPSLVQDELSHTQRDAFNRIFRVQVSESPLRYSSSETRNAIGEAFKVPEEFRDMRRAVRITNTIIGEESIVNPLRSVRPVQTTPGDQIEALQKANPRENCAFCHWEEKTPMDDFGRVETKETVTAANLFAFDGLHSLVIPKNIHDPLELTEEVFTDMIHTANEWFKRAMRYNPRARFPLAIYNNFPKGGSSVYHPHIQVMAAEDQPYRELENLRKNMADYQYFNHVPFMEDMAYSLRGLGLVHDMDTAHIIFNPTAVKEREVMIYSNDTGKLPNGDLSHAAFSIIEWWRRIGVTSFDMVVYMPPLGLKDESYWHNFYPLMRMVDRGSEGAKTSDFGTMEVYVSPVVASDQLKQSAMFGQFLESTQKLAAAA